MSAKPDDAPSIIPIPDPSAITTAIIKQEIAHLRELLQARLDGMDKAVEVLRDLTGQFPTKTDEKISGVRETLTQKLLTLESTLAEKFNSVQIQFKERDVRTEQSAKDSKIAVDAALQAAKEAVGEQNKSSALAIAKSEAAVTKQIDQLSLQMQTLAKASDEKIGDVKDRVNRFEGRGAGASALWGYLVGAVGLLLALAARFLK